MHSAPALFCESAAGALRGRELLCECGLWSLLASSRTPAAARAASTPQRQTPQRQRAPPPRFWRRFWLPLPQPDALPCLAGGASAERRPAQPAASGRHERQDRCGAFAHERSGASGRDGAPAPLALLFARRTAQLAASLEPLLDLAQLALEPLPARKFGATPALRQPLRTAAESNAHA